MVLLQRSSFCSALFLVIILSFAAFVLFAVTCSQQFHCRRVARDLGSSLARPFVRRFSSPEIASQEADIINKSSPAGWESTSSHEARAGALLPNQELRLDAANGHGGGEAEARRTLWDSSSDGPVRTLVAYVYYEKEPSYAKTFEYFVATGIFADDDMTHFAIVLNGGTTVDILGFRNVFVIRRDNVCYDMGSYGFVLAALGWDFLVRTYKFFIFLNSSIRGPYLPRYMPPGTLWTDMFTNRLSEEVKLVGLTANCPAGPGEISPSVTHVMSMLFATDRIGLHILWQAGVFKCAPLLEVALFAEAAISYSILMAGFNFEVMQLMYRGWDWSVKMMQPDPCEEIPENVFFNLGRYGGADVHPLELIFYKGNYHNADKLIASYTNFGMQMIGEDPVAFWNQYLPHARQCQPGKACVADSFRHQLSGTFFSGLNTSHHSISAPSVLSILRAAASVKPFHNLRKVKVALVLEAKASSSDAAKAQVNAPLVALSSMVGDALIGKGYTVEVLVLEKLSLESLDKLWDSFTIFYFFTSPTFLFKLNIEEKKYGSARIALIVSPGQEEQLVKASSKQLLSVHRFIFSSLQSLCKERIDLVEEAAMVIPFNWRDRPEDGYLSDFDVADMFLKLVVGLRLPRNEDSGNTERALAKEAHESGKDNFYEHKCSALQI